MMKTRTETDSIGVMEVPADATVVNLSILEKFQNSFSPDFIGI